MIVIIKPGIFAQKFLPIEFKAIQVLFDFTRRGGPY